MSRTLRADADIGPSLPGVPYGAGMSQERTKRLDVWWATLTEDQRAELLALETGDPLPAKYVVGLTRALGVGPIAVGWVEAGGPQAFGVDSRIGDFLAAKRNHE
jgi:hypothetical protein